MSFKNFKIHFKNFDILQIIILIIKIRITLFQFYFLSFFILITKKKQKKKHFPPLVIDSGIKKFKNGNKDKKKCIMMNTQRKITILPV